MATRFHIGAKELRGAIGAYAKRFDLLEVRAAGAPSGPAALKRWRKSVPPHFEFSVVAGAALGRLKPSPELDRDLEATVAARDALQARCILLPTPVEVTPSAVWRERLARVVERLAHDAGHVAWEPRGVWEHDEAAAFAKKIGLVLVTDASRDPVPLGPVAYVRLRALGETRSYGAAALERVVQAIGDRREAYVVLETDSALEECKRLRQLAQRPSSFRGGMGRVVRPRGTTMKVRDDEQE